MYPKSILLKLKNLNCNPDDEILIRENQIETISQIAFNSMCRKIEIKQNQKKNKKEQQNIQTLD